MKIGLYYKPTGPAAGWFNAIKQGGESLGAFVVFRNPAPFSAYMTHPYDLVAVLGHGIKNDEIIQAYGAKGIPVLVMEGAYFNAGHGFVSVGLGRHYWTPDFPCPDDRFKAFGLELKPRQEGGDYILVCGQDNATWCQKTAKDLRFVTDKKIVFRPHPRKPFEVPKAHEVSAGRTFEEDMAGAFLVACETSNVGNMALMAGKPVLCPPYAMFAGLANTDLLTVENPRFPSDDELWDYFNRLAYAVWGQEELASGAALTFFLGAAKGEPVFPDHIAEVSKKVAQQNPVGDPHITSSQDKITVITPTGDRPEALALLRQWMSNQTRKPDQWLIIDDGKKKVRKDQFPKPDYVQVVRRRPRADDPACTLGKNLEAAAPLIAHDKVIVLEDDDWYGPDYIKTMAALLDAHDLVGISGTKYYHPGIPGYREMGRGDHASLSQTAFRKSYLPRVIESIPFDPALPDFPECSVDMRLWKKSDGLSSYLMPGADKKLHCSIKGLPGRPGAGVGHDKRFYKKDPDLSKFKEWCGDVEAYRGFIGKG